METIEGRTFTDDILCRVTRLVEDEPGISRRQLSARVCEMMDWRNTVGTLQDMSCRKALLELERRGAIRLPVVQKRFSFQEKRAPAAPPPIAAVECPLAELGTLEIVKVTRGALSRLWTGMMDAYHYLKSGPLCGAQVRYLIRSEHCGWVAGLSFSASALKVEARDVWFGWSEEARRRNHIYVVNNSRFLVPPSVKVKNLASHVLARCRERVGDDWDELYGYRPVMLETYVERDRFEGTCYRAANWLRVGSTKGRGRKGTGTTIKDVYVMPLEAQWQSTLCRQSDGTILVRRAPEPPPPRDWIEAEVGGAELGDRRLTARLLQMTGMFYGKPTANIPGECGSAAATKAAYRFLDNEAVDWQAILKPHFSATEERVRAESVTLVVQDTTFLNYTSHPNTTGLGPIGTEHQDLAGLVLHGTMAFTPAGTPLGLLDAQCWAREGYGSRHERHEKPIEDKESYKWIESYRAASAVQKRCRTSRLVVVADREADIHELFAEQAGTRHGADLLIRAERARNRRVIDDDDNHDYLWATLAAQPVLDTREVMVRPREGRPGRQARLEVRWTRVTLHPPKRKSKLEPVPVWAVYAYEPEAPDGAEALEWMLLTTVEVKDKADASERLGWYERRWGIEVYHRVLKSGCRIESRQLENAHRLRNCMAIDMIVAWRIYYLTMLGKETPDVPCTVYFADAEWKALATFTARAKEPPKAPPTLHEAVGMIGALGGHLGRAGDEEPGAEVLWRGMARLADLAVAYELYH
ncbi:MAG: IS4 family transposase [Vicinamibacterales bacterium]